MKRLVSRIMESEYKTNGRLNSHGKAVMCQMFSEGARKYRICEKLGVDKKTVAYWAMEWGVKQERFYGKEAHIPSTEEIEAYRVKRRAYFKEWRARKNIKPKEIIVPPENCQNPECTILLKYGGSGTERYCEDCANRLGILS